VPILRYNQPINENGIQEILMRNYLLIGIAAVIISSFAMFWIFDARNRIHELERHIQDSNSPAIEVDRAEAILNRAEDTVDLATNLLSLFEALSLAVTIGGVVLVSLGLGRFNDARNELIEARQEVKQEIDEYRQNFNAEIKAREDELNLLREELEASANHDRQATTQALLANALLPLGERQYKASDYEGAIATYQRALELHPDNPVVNQRLGYVYTQMGNLDEAKRHYEKALDVEPNFAPVLAGLGLVTRRFAERLDKVVDDPALFEGERVQKHLERNQLLTEAESYLQRALQISPRLVDDDGESWWGVLGGLYKRRSLIKDAIAAYHEATVVTPQSSYGYGNLAQLYMKQGDIQKMLATFERVEQIASKEADATGGNFWGYADLAVSSYAIGKHEQAARVLPIAMQIAPLDSPFMLEGLVETLREIVEMVPEDRRPPIREAITYLAEEMARRAEQLRRITDGKTGEIEVVAKETSS
jgi:tetratricopeptide (TPR) repeat protein